MERYSKGKGGEKKAKSGGRFSFFFLIWFLNHLNPKTKLKDTFLWDGC